MIEPLDVWSLTETDVIAGSAPLHVDAVAATGSKKASATRTANEALMKLRWIFILAIVPAFALGACSGGNGTSSQTASPAPSPGATVLIGASPTMAGTPLGTAGPSVAVKQVAITDINGDFGEQAIKDEAALGILNTTTGPFRPNAPITRAQFVRWLVTANNIYFKDSPGKQIRLAKTGPAQFVDVPVSNPRYPEIQGLANAGYVIGIDSKHFAPNRPITREEMLAIKDPVDEGQAIKMDTGMAEFDLQRFSDVKQINKRYVGAIDEDRSVRTTQNIARIWGSIKALMPRKSVTRSEAAIAIWEIGDGNAAVALGRTAPPPPK